MLTSSRTKQGKKIAKDETQSVILHLLGGWQISLVLKCHSRNDGGMEEEEEEEEEEAGKSSDCGGLLGE